MRSVSDTHKSKASRDWTYEEWYRQELFERDYEAALHRLASVPHTTYETGEVFTPKAQMEGMIYWLMEDIERARASFDSARVILEAEAERRPEDFRLHGSLGVVYAGLGRKRDAIQEGELAVELLPISKDACIGPGLVENLAFICVMVAEHDSALAHIESILSVPSWFSVELLRIDPRWDPLRDHPRYGELLREYSHADS